MPIYTLNHIHHETENIEEAVAFYQKLFQATCEPPVERGGALWAYVRIGDITVVVTNRPAAATRLERLLGLDHFALTTDDFDSTLEEIGRTGTPIWLGPLKQVNGRRLVFVNGPDNIKIEIMEALPE